MARRSLERRRGDEMGASPASKRPLLLFSTIAAGVLTATAFAWAAIDAAAQDAAANPSLAPIYLAGFGCLLVSCLVVVVHGTRTAHRVAGPEHRLIQSIRRIRKGDLAFRVSLRKGDLLTSLAAECNALLEHLNEHPPVGSKTGTDLVDVVIPAEPREVEHEVARELEEAMS